MSTTTRVRQQKTAPVYGFKAVEGAADGTFEAYVSVFGNVDLAKERVVAGAFKSSLERWKASGDPIPVIFSHQWENLDAHVGEVLEAEERAAGDSRLPAELAGLGGLWVKGALDLDEDFAARLWKKMSKRRIKEFSFAYDVEKAKPGSDGAALDLLELDLIEVGPTLKGMNPDTVLVNAKAAQEAGLGPLEVLDLVGSMSKGLDAKRLPSGALDGAVESTLNSIRESATIWAELEYRGELYTLHLEATFLEENRALVTAERWEDPWGEGPVWELSYSVADDGTVTIDEATELEVTVELAPKRAERASRTFAELAALSRKLAPLGVADGDPDTPASDGKADDPHKGKADDPTSGAPAPTAAVTPLGVIARAAELEDALS